MPGNNQGHCHVRLGRGGGRCQVTTYPYSARPQAGCRENHPPLPRQRPLGLPEGSENGKAPVPGGPASHQPQPPLARNWRATHTHNLSQWIFFHPIGLSGCPPILWTRGLPAGTPDRLPPFSRGLHLRREQQSATGSVPWPPSCGNGAATEGSKAKGPDHPGPVC